MLHKLDFSDKFATVKTFLLGLFIGAVITAFYLDNRLGAMIKAFKNPQAVNSAVISMEVIKK